MRIELLLAALAGAAAGIAIGAAADWLPRRLARPPLPSTPTAAAWLPLAACCALALYFLVLWERLGGGANFFFMAALGSFLTLIALIDLKYRLVLNAVLYPGTALMLLARAAGGGSQAWVALLGGLTAFAVFLLVALLAPAGLGGGDVKLAAFLGVTFGFPYVFWALTAGVFAGGVAALALLIARRGQRRTKIAYAPFLCLGAFVAIFFNPIPWLLAI